MGSADNRADFWEVELLRLTIFFPSDSPPVDSDQWWNQLIGEPPENKNERPREGTLQQDGIVDASRVTLSVIPGRVDLISGVDQSPLKQPFEVVPTMGLLSKRLGPFMNMAQQLIKLTPGANRFAFGAILIHPVSDRREGYAELSRYLSALKIDIENSRDFSYQINRPRPSATVIGCAINRLSKWAVVLVQPLRIQIIGDAKGQQVAQFIGTGFNAVRLELDISSDSDRIGKLPVELSIPFWDELVSMGLEISAEGDLQ